MIIESLGFRNFRALSETKIDTSKKYVVFSAENGEGKTSILEAIYFCLTGTSFRTKNLKNTINLLKSDNTVKLEIDDDNKKFFIENNYDGKEKKLFVNDKKVNDRKSIILNFPCIVFINEDIDFIIGSSKDRRKFFDQVISYSDEEYLIILKKYSYLIEERNKLLKLENQNYSIYDDYIATLNSTIQEKREFCVKKINAIINAFFPLFFEKFNKVSIEYKKSIDSNNVEIIKEVLKNSLEKDIKDGCTNKGIHRDNFVVKYDNKVFEEYASKGQLRILAILYRVAEIIYINEETNKKPFVLIDDIFLELDKNRRRLFFEKIENFSQLFLTFLPDENYFLDKKGDTLYYEIRNGEVKKINE